MFVLFISEYNFYQHFESFSLKSKIHFENLKYTSIFFKTICLQISM